jgi:hypothetical protein
VLGCLWQEDASWEIAVDYDLSHLKDPEGLAIELRCGPQQETPFGVDDEVVLVSTPAEGVEGGVCQVAGAAPG